MADIEELKKTKVIYRSPLGQEVGWEPPSQEEMMNKINEIIRQVNYLSKRKQDKPLRNLGSR